MLPHDWKNNLTAKNASAHAQDVYALQTAMINDGEYPPADENKNTCPRSGMFGACTKSSLASFQNKYGILGEKGIVSSSTRGVLNSKFGLSAI